MGDGAPLGGKEYGVEVKRDEKRTSTRGMVLLWGYGVKVKRDEKRTSPWGMVLLWEVKDMGLRLRGMKRELRRGGWCSFGR